MPTIWYPLALNIATLAFLVWLWARVDQRLMGFPRWTRSLVMGLAMSLAAVMSIATSTEVVPGVFVDLRSVPILLAGYVGGPMSGLLVAALSGGYRYSLGGVGTMPAMIGIGLGALLGAFGHYLKGLAPAIVDVCVLSILAALLPYATAAISNGPVLDPADLLVLSLARGLGTFVAVAMVLHDQRQRLEQSILLAAISQVQDYFYVKDRDLKFVAVNQTVASHYGFPSPKHMVGLTDHDLEQSERIDRVAILERDLIGNPRVPVTDVELVALPEGNRWFESTKSALKGTHDEVLGLVGVTRDVTKTRRLEEQLQEERDLFEFLVDEMPVGLALFDAGGVLRYCNSKYRSAFPLTGHLRVPGTHISRLLRAVVASGEQKHIEPGDGENWVERISAALSKAGDQEIQLFDEKWLHIRTRPTKNGASLVVVSDVSSMKRSEKALIEMTGQLTQIATIDAVTGVLTRRALDARVRAEMVTSEQRKEPIAVLMADIDHFKLYNDTYGHVAGDLCLKRVAECFSSAMRSGDIVGRYGGEEFVAVLPGADTRSALAAADRFLARLAKMAEPHSSTAMGYVTASVGLAVYGATDIERTPERLIERADSALYQSKSMGRNRSTLFDGETTWRSRAVS